jgi:hypothetical protein
MEVYNGNKVSEGIRPQFSAWGLKRGPVLFAINRLGVVVSRIEGAFSVPELKAAVRRALR